MISTWLASSYTEGNGSSAGRVALVAVAVLAVVAYVILQLRSRSRRAAGTRRYDPWDWRTYPEEGSPADQGLAGPEEGRRPEWRYGYPPGYEPCPLYESADLPWAVPDEAVPDKASLATLRVLKVFASVQGKRVDWPRFGGPRDRYGAERRDVSVERTERAGRVPGHRDPAARRTRHEVAPAGRAG